MIKVLLWLMDKYHKSKCLKLSVSRHGRNTPIFRFFKPLHQLV